jgi:hypothetical protein
MLQAPIELPASPTCDRGRKRGGFGENHGRDAYCRRADESRAPGEGFLHGLPLQMAYGHLGHDALNVDLHRDLRRSWRRGYRQDLVVVGIGVVIERPFRRPLLRLRATVVGAFVPCTVGRRSSSGVFSGFLVAAFPGALVAPREVLWQVVAVLGPLPDQRQRSATLGFGLFRTSRMNSCVAAAVNCDPRIGLHSGNTFRKR